MRKEVEFRYFVITLRDRILQGEYKVGNQHYQIPISAVERYKLKKRNVQEVFLTDV